MPREKDDSRERSDRAVATRAPDPPAGDEHRTVPGRGASTSVGEAPIAAFSAGRLVGLDGLISLSWALDAVRAHASIRKALPRLSPPRIAPAKDHLSFSVADSRVFSSPTQQLPHKVKARKEIAAWPLKVKLGAEYDLIAKKFSGHADCHDSLLGGELSFDVLHSNVEYTKRFDLGDVSSIGIRARCDLSNLGSHSGTRTRMDRCDASFGFTIEPKQSRGPLGANTPVSNTRGSGYDVVTEVSLF